MPIQVMRLRSNSEAAWTPASLDTQLWLDASDASTLTLDTGRVVQWSDKSGKGRNVGATGTTRPSYVTSGLGARPVIRFDGTRERLSRSSGLMAGMIQNVDGYLIVALRSHRVAVTAIRSVLVVSIASGGSARALLEGGRSGAQKVGAGGRRLDADAFQSVASTNVITPGFSIASVSVNHSTTTAEIFTNGVADGGSTSFQTAGLTSNTTSSGISIGANGGGTADWFDGDIAELVVMNGVQAPAVREQIEAYLMAKWVP